MFCSKSTITAFLTALLGLFFAKDMANACPFCSAASQTLRQEMSSMDVVGFASLVPSDKDVIDGQATFKVTKVVRGDSLAHEGDTLSAPYFGPGKTDKEFLVMAVKSDELLWSSPLTLTPNSRKYIENVFKLPTDDTLQRLRFFYEYLDSKEPLLAGDAYDEFALAPYAEVKLMKDDLQKDKIWKWISDDTVSPDRKRLYYTLLGIVADKSDAKKLEERLRSEDANQRAGLDALIACYLTVAGDEGLPLINEVFLENTKCSYADTYAAIQALRFQGTDGGAIGREKLLESFRIMLARPDYADLVIPDLARWEDWTQVDRLAELFKKADNSTSWVRVPVINYLRMCPLPEAKATLAELEKLDPKAFQRASTYFPLPAAPAPAPEAAPSEKTDKTDETNSKPGTATSSLSKPSINDGTSWEPSTADDRLSLSSDTPSLVAFLHESKNASKYKMSEQGTVVEPVNQLNATAVTVLAVAFFSMTLGLIIVGRSSDKSYFLATRQFLQRCLS